MNSFETSQSNVAFQRAAQCIPGGVNSPARAFGGVGGSPLFIEKGNGFEIQDLDGNSYIDYCGSWGPLILGHRHPHVLAAIEDVLSQGTSFGAPTLLETDLAEQVVKAVPSVEKVRMVNSGTEATMSAVRLARGYTQRDVIVKFSGCYHGHVDSLLVQAGSSATTLGVPSSPGVPSGCAADTVSLPFNDIDQIHQFFEKEGDRVAGVIVEPVAGNMGVVLPKKGFLEVLRELTKQHGAVLIFDEVMTGFRLAYGGAQERLGIIPDLTTMGKIIGGGLPVGAYGGRSEIMNHMLPEGTVFQAGTLSGNPLAMACGKATLDAIEENPPYERLETLGARLAQGFHEAAHKAGIPHTVGHAGSMVTLFFHDKPVTDYETASECDTDAFGRFFWGMLKRGIYLPCSQFEAAFVSDAMGIEQIEQTIDAATDTLCSVQ